MLKIIEIEQNGEALIQLEGSFFAIFAQFIPIFLENTENHVHFEAIYLENE